MGIVIAVTVPIIANFSFVIDTHNIGIPTNNIVGKNPNRNLLLFLVLYRFICSPP